MINRPDTLIILTPGFPEDEADSTCIPPQQVFVKALKENNPQLNIIVLTFHYPFFSARYQWNGVDVISFGGERKGRFYRKIMDVRVWAELKKINKEYHIIGLLSFWLGKCAFIGSWFAEKYHLTHYCWILGQDAKAGNKYVRKINPKGKSLIALSDFIATEFYKNYGILPQHIIPVGIDTSLFAKVIPEKNIDIIGAGSFIPLKQYDIFVEVIKLLKEDFPAIKTCICGDGPEMMHLRTMIDVMDLEDNIKLLGRQSHAQVLTLMQRSKVLLHPSNYEGFGAVCLEALYANAQVVSFVKPMDAAIENWHIAEDKASMVQILKTILQNQDLKYQSILPYSIHDNAKVAMKLFDYNPVAIS
ncbi:glycosyltransferase family 4 protein [Mucilaginibacter sp. L196]|uniref:glycosyltransferase family 4 protein n=1 Tax=Mucilaginibacter sp. L196 TaxID=1641870 RepID=UPI00131C1324|nr:glycosyltransferase family 4 protein [Mucilaginibacter sp. L196]